MKRYLAVLVLGALPACAGAGEDADGSSATITASGTETGGEGCGDGLVDGEEACDDGENNGAGPG